ncbi:hypothetical protein Z946_2656 [Sulfitobacter noctilucicola]|uniref:Uncharacterized protein n=1 Tax=Sulfitobacter noctilucicola TaxID=1342301 RepID=A0A7W6M932_9RHOB|nr:hypothetical protein [Sulfitobacter noctilucicola]KIN63782.1 hypothetical protein Z946_2656 [Sulfitobacter noctilucicola]MBB4174709.1 hypothetical protein [Sulfitobacter noctilucicola]
MPKMHVAQGRLALLTGHAALAFDSKRALRSFVPASTTNQQR